MSNAEDRSGCKTGEFAVHQIRASTIFSPVAVYAAREHEMGRDIRAEAGR